MHAAGNGRLLLTKNRVVELMHKMIEYLLTRLRENIRVVREAWETVIVTALLSGLIVWMIAGALHQERISVLNDRIGGLNDQLIEYRTKLKGATPEEAEKQITSLRQELSDMKDAVSNIKRQQAAQMPRTLTEQQRANFAAAATTLSPVQVLISNDLDCSDCRNYAKDLMNMINAIAGWSAIGGATQIGTSYTLEGVTIVGLKKSPEVQALTTALRAAKIQFNMQDRVVSKYYSAPVELSVHAPAAIK